MELLVVGLDGVSPNMLREFDVETTFLDAVERDGVDGDLRSVDAPTTLPAWTSFATGKDPGSHGVATMLQQGTDYDIVPSRPNTTDAAAYDLIDDALFVNLPGSIGRTPAAAGTRLVSSFLASDKADAVPAELRSVDGFEEYVVHADTDLQATPERYFEHLVETTRARHDFAAEAFGRFDPRVGFVLFSTPDWVGHHLQFAPDGATGSRWYRTVLEACDEFAAALADRAENVLLLSDHGFEPKPKAIHLQTWLEREGYLATADERSSLQRLATGTATQVARRFDTLFDLLRTAYLRVTSATGGERLGDVVDFNPDVDFAASRAWQLRYGCLYVNADRFDSPTVEDADALRAELRDRLAGLTDDDGTPVFQSVHELDEVYADPDPDAMLPDLVARPAPGYLPLRAFSPTGDPVIDMPGHDHYDHRYDGLVAADGPLFAAGTVDGMSIVDVLPTILHALGESLPPDLDGEVRTGMLRTDAAPTVLDPGAVPDPRTRDTGTDRAAAAREQLRNLGYLE
jgi:predicted AlkP superfamily phosphohydrolase/phosphomutase